ncbi:hypothetical protein ACHAWF_012558, partial [Thalassiosira exigua]
FAAAYAAGNLLRILCRDDAFVEYAARWSRREEHLEGVKAELSAAGGKAAAGTGGGGGGTTSKEQEEEKVGEEDRNERLRRLQKRGRESDEKTRKIKEQVRRHFGGDGGDEGGSPLAPNSSSSSAAAASSPASGGGSRGDDAAATSTAIEDTDDYRVAAASYDHGLMTLLERALRDAFADLDAEILRKVQGETLEDEYAPYGTDGPSGGGGGGVAHLPPDDDAAGGADPTKDAADRGGKGDDPSSSSSPPPPSSSPEAPNDDEDAGTTACVVLLTPRWIVCANAGDSRAVYARSGSRAVPLSYDHKPDDEDEERRVREAGGYVAGGRVEGDLAVSRGLGDYRFKDVDACLSGAAGENRRRDGTVLQRQIRSALDDAGNNDGDDDDDEEEDWPMLRPSEQKVSPIPDVIVQNRDPDEDEFVVVACDGIWDVQTNQECVREVAEIFGEGEDDVGLVCEEILDQCLIKGSKDNMTAAVIKLPKQSVGTGGGVTARRERRGANDDAKDGKGGKKDGGDGRPQGQLRRVGNPYVPPAQREGGAPAGG